MTDAAWTQTMSEVGGFFVFVLTIGVLYALVSVIILMLGGRMAAKRGPIVPVYIRSIKHLMHSYEEYTDCGIKVAGSTAGDAHRRRADNRP